MATNLRSNDTIQVRIPQGGGSVRDVALSELNEYISSEEASDISDLETLVGDYTPEDTDIATDLTAALSDINDLEAQVGDYDPISTGSTITADLAAVAAVAPEYTATFATATAASGTLTLTGNPTAGDRISIGTAGNEIVYKIVPEVTAAYEVDLGASASDTIDNLIAAITYDGGAGTNEGTLYGTGTDAHTEVTAAAGEDDTMTVTALVKGAAGNGIGTTDPVDDGTVMSFGATTLQGGIDGEVGATGKVIFTASAVYCCTDGTKCVVTDSSGWKSVTFS